MWKKLKVLLKIFKPILAALGAIVLIPPAVDKYWKLFFTFPIPTLLAKFFVCLGIIVIFYQHYQKRNRIKRPTTLHEWRVTNFVFSLLFIWQIVSAALEEIGSVRNAHQIRMALLDGLARTYSGDTDGAAFDFSKAAELVKKGSNWADAAAYVATCNQELAFLHGSFDPDGKEFADVKALVRGAKDHDMLGVWLKFLEAEARSKSGDDADANELLMEVRHNNPPTKVSCYLDMLLAINARRMNKIEDSKQFYQDAFVQAKENQSFPFWKFDLVRGNVTDDLYSIHIPLISQAFLITPYSELLWEGGERQEAVKILSEWSNTLTNDPYFYFPVANNLGVLYWRMHDYRDAEKTFTNCEIALQIMRYRTPRIKEYEYVFDSNLAGLRLEEMQMGSSTNDIEQIEKMLSEAAENYSTDAHHVRDRKMVFQMQSDEAILKSMAGDGPGALALFHDIESKSGLFDGCDPCCVARFYECYTVTAKGQRVNEHEVFRLSTAAAYWRFKSGDLEQTNLVNTMKISMQPFPIKKL